MEVIKDCDKQIFLLQTQDYDLLNKMNFDERITVDKFENDQNLNPLENYCSLNFYINKRQKAMQRIKEKSEVINSANLGFAFIYFEKKEDTEKFKEYMRKIKNLNRFKKNAISNKHYHMQSWAIEKSTEPNNIIWSKFNQKTPYDTFLDILLNIFLFTIIIAASPVAWAQYLAL